METSSRAIVLWGREDLIVSSFAYYLATRKDWNVISFSKKESIENLDQVVRTTDPDLVIIRLGEYNVPTLLPLQLVQDHPALRVITVRLENNSLEVYGNHFREQRKASDLVSVVDNLGYQPLSAMVG